MQRRTFLTALLAGVGASIAASQAQALTALAPKPATESSAVPAPQFGVATPEDIENAKPEKTWYRRRWWWRRRPYWRRRWGWRRW